MNLEPRKVARLHLEQQACSHEDALAVHPGNEIYYQPAMHAWPFSYLCSGVCVHRRHTSGRTRTPFHTCNRQLSRRRHMACKCLGSAAQTPCCEAGVQQAPQAPAVGAPSSGPLEKYMPGSWAVQAGEVLVQQLRRPPAPVPWQPNPPALLPHDLQQDKTKRVCFAGSPAKE